MGTTDGSFSGASFFKSIRGDPPNQNLIAGLWKSKGPPRALPLLGCLFLRGILTMHNLRWH